MKRRDDTSMGGGDDKFQKTPWTEIIHARAQGESRRQAALAELLRKYWKPVYCYVRRRGYENEPAKDLVQGFFHEVVLGRDLMGRADRTRGRFRTFLLTALDHYLAGVRRVETAKKRRPAGQLVRLDGMDLPEPFEATQDLTPEEAFHHAWASTLLDEVLEVVEKLCRESGQEIHWEVFRARVVRPVMEDAEPPSLTELCGKHGISDEAKASNMIITVKRRFQVILRRQVRQFVGTDAEVAEEIREIIAIISRS